MMRLKLLMLLTVFVGWPGDPVETLLSIKGGVVENTLKVNYGTDYPSKDLIRHTIL